MATMQAARHDPELATFEQSCQAMLAVATILAGLSIAFQPLQVGANLRGVLVAQVAIFLQTLADDLFQLRTACLDSIELPGLALD